MGTTLQHGIFLPAEGERNCYAGLASNWTILDGVVGGYSSHAANLTIHVTAADKETWNGKADTSALTAHTGNTTIHVTAEDKETWNGKADASALTAHMGNTTIHVTAEDKQAWNGKQDALSQTQLDAVNSGIDSSKVQQIATNTSDISSLQSGKANDNSVVHTSGNETVGGQKTFSDNLTIYNSDNTVTPKGLAIRNAQWGMGESGATTVSSINFLDKNSSVPASVIASKGFYGQSYLRFAVRTKDSQNTTYSEEIYYDIDTSGNVEFRSWHDNTTRLGTSIYKWKDVQTKLINGITPSSLSLPSTTGVVDISSYITDLTGTANTYTVLANGYIQFDVTGSSIEIDVTNGLSQKWIMTDPKGFIPVVSGASVSIKVVGTAINNFKFIPCQGNA